MSTQTLRQLQEHQVGATYLLPYKRHLYRDCDRCGIPVLQHKKRRTVTKCWDCRQVEADLEKWTATIAKENTL